MSEKKQKEKQEQPNTTENIISLSESYQALSLKVTLLVHVSVQVQMIIHVDQ